jgi:hypothetical protein
MSFSPGFRRLGLAQQALANGEGGAGGLLSVRSFDASRPFTCNRRHRPSRRSKTQRDRVNATVCPGPCLGWR